jgi:hypothetical protein
VGSLSRAASTLHSVRTLAISALMFEFDDSASYQAKSALGFAFSAGSFRWSILTDYGSRRVAETDCSIVRACDIKETVIDS